MRSPHSIVTSTADTEREYRMRRSVLVIGASGDVGLGITTVLLKAGWNVIACARSQVRLHEMHTQFASDLLTPVQGDIATEAGTRRLWQDVIAVAPKIDAVIVTVSAPASERQILGWNDNELLQLLQDNVITHFNAAKCIVPELRPGAIYIGIGGGMADFIAPRAGHISMCQASIRRMYQAIHEEYGNKNLTIRELMIMSMVNGRSRRHIAKKNWITDMEVGQHVLEILQSPQHFPDPILKLKPLKHAPKR